MNCLKNLKKSPECAISVAKLNGIKTAFDFRLDVWLVEWREPENGKSPEH